jgi:hypothetical protein
MLKFPEKSRPKAPAIANDPQLPDALFFTHTRFESDESPPSQDAPSASSTSC